MIKVSSFEEAYAITGMKSVICGSDGIYVQVATSEEIEAERLNKWRQIEAMRESKYNNGVKIEEHWFQTSAWSKINYMGAAMLGAAFPGTGWKTMTGEEVWLTGQFAGQIMAAIAVHTDAVFKAAQAHKEAMMISEDPSVYDFSTGWPETFGEYQET